MEVAVRNICGDLRRRLNAVSVVALSEPTIVTELRRKAAGTAAAETRKELEDREDYRSLAESYAEESAGLKVQIENISEQLANVREQLYRLQTESAWSDQSAEAAANVAVAPETILEAVNRARLLLAGLVVIGNDVTKGVGDLAPDAGPPGKVYSYLDALGALARERRSGPLGIGMIQWLAARNCIASTESETIKNSSHETAKRTWHDGHEKRVFELHLKPNEGVHPDKCVRIYFDWDEATEQVVVGWVGRHP